jgi:hypothetical protein
MAYGFGYYGDVAGVNYNDPYNNYNPYYNYNRQPNYLPRNRDNNWSDVILGAGLGYLLGFSPLIGAGFGALLSDIGGQNTNVVNINTGRRYY